MSGSPHTLPSGPTVVPPVSVSSPREEEAHSAPLPSSPRDSDASSPTITRAASSSPQSTATRSRKLFYRLRSQMSILGIGTSHQIVPYEDLFMLGKEYPKVLTLKQIQRCQGLLSDKDEERVLLRTQSIQRDFTSRIWITYRKGFPPLLNTNKTSDSGWGCMLRSAQMLLAGTFMSHFLRRSWAYDDKSRNHRVYAQVHCLVPLFLSHLLMFLYYMYVLVSLFVFLTLACLSTLHLSIFRSSGGFSTTLHP